MGLQLYVDAWLHSMRAIAALEIDEPLGQLETSLPGWRVRDIVAHLVHLEETLAFGENSSSLDQPALTRVSGEVESDYTETGVDRLRPIPVSELLTRLDAAVKVRAEQLDPLPEDPSARGERTPDGIDWDWDTLLRNRAIDAWMHEQDIRRAIGRAGNLDSPGAAVTVRSFAAALPLIVGKRAAVPPGHPVCFEVGGPIAFSETIAVAATGRAAKTDEAPLTVIVLNSESFARLAGGREPVETFDIRVTGDAEIASRILGAFAITP